MLWVRLLQTFSEPPKAAGGLCPGIQGEGTLQSGATSGPGSKNWP